MRSDINLEGVPVSIAGDLTLNSWEVDFFFALYGCNKHE